MLRFWGLVFAIAACFQAGGAERIRRAPKWSVYEIPLESAHTASNPYLETDLAAEFSGPRGLRKTVHGFWAGGSNYRIRFTPTAEGRWNYRTKSNDSGLDGKTGVIECTSPLAGAHGFLRRDAENPHHWRFDDRTRYFMLGQTYYEIVGTARDKGDYRSAVNNSARYGVNKIRFRTFVKTCGNRENPFQCTSPYLADKDHLDLDHWRAVDEVVEYLASKGVIADFMPFNSGAAYFGTAEQDRRLLDYMLARYAAYPNVIWCVTNEFQRTGRPQQYMNVLGAHIRQNDPWMSEGDSLRGLSIHPLGGKGQGDYWKFADQTWPVHIILQIGRKSPADPPLYAEMTGNRQYNMPVVNDEFGYFGDSLWWSEQNTRGDGGNYYTREKHRNALWAIYMAGAYASIGDKFEYQDGRPYKTSLWHDRPEYEDVAALTALFTQKRIEYWRMTPDPSVVTKGNRVYALALTGKQYVFYAAAGGAFAVNLPPAQYEAVLFNPRNASEKRIGAIDGERHEFETPEGEDWVVYLRSK